MKAEIKKPIATDRHNLKDVLPLSSPYMILLEFTRYCNFKCYYCMQSSRGDENGELAQAGLRIAHIDDALCDRIIEQIMTFDPLPKRLLIAGLGEPLMYKKLPEVIKKFRSYGYNGKIEIITNGYLLTPEMSDKLLEAGISKIRISVQGLNAEQYEKNCGVRIDYERFVENLKYFYEHKSENVELYIKIMDTMIHSKDEEEQFYHIFGDICDSIFIETLIVSQQEMETAQGEISGLNVYGEKYEAKQICAIVTYKLQINLEGECLPCDISGLSPKTSFGNIKDSSLLDIWNGNRRKEIIKKHLAGKRQEIPICNTCTAYLCVQVPEENIDACAMELYEKY